MNTDPSLTVVVCSYNGANKISKCLEALSLQSVKVDVLVVDDGSTDGTSSIAEGFGFPVIRHESNKGLSAARNTGLSNVISTIVAYTDDDCVPPPEWTERLLSAWRANPQATVVGGMVDVYQPTTFSQHYCTYRNPLIPTEIAINESPSVWYRIRRQFRPPLLPRIGTFPVYSVVGANMSVHRERVLEVGGYDEGLLFGEGEEAAICVAVRARFGDGSVLVDPQLVLAHNFENSMVGVLRRSFTYGLGAAERWKKQSGWPSIPIPAVSAIVVAAVLAPLWWPAALVGGLGILSIPCAVWASRTTTRLSPVVLAYPFAAFTDDAVKIFGFVKGALRNGKFKSGTKLILPLMAAIAIFGFTPISHGLLRLVNGSFAPKSFTSLALQSPAQAVTGVKKGVTVRAEVTNETGRSRTYTWRATEAGKLVGLGEQRVASGQTATISVSTKYAAKGPLRIKLDGTNVFVTVPVLKS